MIITTADMPFYHFLGTAMFSFFSNDSAVVGSRRALELLKRQGKSAGGKEEKVQERFVDYLFGKWDWDNDNTAQAGKFDAGEFKFDLFNYNYDRDNDRAQQSRIPLLSGSAGSIYCEECYVYAGL
jgi:hypothetical protein